MKSQTVLMTHQIEAAMKTRIEALDWMSPSTKAQALEQARGCARQGRLSRRVARLLGARASSAATSSVTRFAAREFD